MESKRILITEANGYLGRKVVNNLSKYNCDLYVSDLAFTKIPEDLKITKGPALSENESILKKWANRIYAFISRGKMGLSIIR